jgi:hypothetical protein
MELEFRDSFLKDVKRIKQTAVKKKITAVIIESQRQHGTYSPIDRPKNETIYKENP